jgi:hypothetical protein
MKGVYAGAGAAAAVVVVVVCWDLAAVIFPASQTPPNSK